MPFHSDIRLLSANTYLSVLQEGPRLDQWTFDKSGRPLDFYSIFSIRLSILLLNHKTEQILRRHTFHNSLEKCASFALCFFCNAIGEAKPIRNSPNEYEYIASQHIQTLSTFPFPFGRDEIPAPMKSPACRISAPPSTKCNRPPRRQRRRRQRRRQPAAAAAPAVRS